MRDKRGETRLTNSLRELVRKDVANCHSVELLSFCVMDRADHDIGFFIIRRKRLLKSSMKCWLRGKPLASYTLLFAVCLQEARLDNSSRKTRCLNKRGGGGHTR